MGQLECFALQVKGGHYGLVDGEWYLKTLVLVQKFQREDGLQPPCIASNQMLLNFGRTKSPGGSSHEMGELATVVGRTHCNASANLVWAFVMPAIRLIDTRLASRRGHYVNRVADALLKATRISIGGVLATRCLRGSGVDSTCVGRLR